jgi:hypothetical protein
LFRASQVKEWAPVLTLAEWAFGVASSTTSTVKR